MEQGTRNRATGATDMNEKSSRSHAIFSVSLKHEKWVPAGGNINQPRTDSPVFGRKRSGSSIRGGGVTSLPSEDGEWMITNSKFHFVDLAGSERVSVFLLDFLFPLKRKENGRGRRYKAVY